jgi:serine/threonine protein kinase
MPIYESDLDADVPWYTMPLASTDLAKPGRQLAGDEAFIQSVFLPVLDAVAAAHGGGVIHRDVKPHNVLQLGDGRWVLSDFGVGVELDRNTTMITRSKESIGTLDYMSPEQYSNPQDCDERTDIFALGKLLLFLIVGDVHDAFRPAALPSHRFTPVLDRALQNDRQQRYLSATDMAKAFRNCLEPAPGAWEHPEVTMSSLSEQLTSGSATAETVDRLTQFLDRYRDRPDFSRRTVPYIPITLLVDLRKRTEDSFKALIRRFDEDVNSSSLDFAYCDVVANFYQRLQQAFPSDVELYKMVLSRLIQMGYEHNRWHVQDVAISLARAAQSDAMISVARMAILDHPEASAWTFENYALGTGALGVDEAIDQVTR